MAMCSARTRTCTLIAADCAQSCRWKNNQKEKEELVKIPIRFDKLLPYRKNHLTNNVKELNNLLDTHKQMFYNIANLMQGCDLMEDNKLSIQNEISNEDIKNLIYTIRGKQVMLDSDVAMLYNYETKNVNKAVKRNIDRFPEDFCFQLTKDEMDKMWFQNGTTSKRENNKYRSEKYLPYAFTEQGIAMLSGILKSDIAIEVSINIMRAFIEMRKFINTNRNLFEKVISIENKMDKKFIEQDKKFDIIFDQLQLEENIKQRVFFEGQIYDAYSIIIDIIKKANKKILIIDNYVDDSAPRMYNK